MVQLGIDNKYSLLVRHFEDQALSGLKPNSDKTVTNPSLKAGVSRYTSYRALALMAQQPVCGRHRSSRHEVVHVIYCQSLSHKENSWCLRSCQIITFTTL